MQSYSQYQMGNRTRGIAYFTQHPDPDCSQIQFCLKRHPKGQVQEYISQVWRRNPVENQMTYTSVRNNNIGSITSEEHVKNTEVQEKLMKIIIKHKRIQANK